MAIGAVVLRDESNKIIYIGVELMDLKERVCVYADRIPNDTPPTKKERM